MKTVFLPVPSSLSPSLRCPLPAFASTKTTHSHSVAKKDTPRRRASTTLTKTAAAKPAAASKAP